MSMTSVVCCNRCNAGAKLLQVAGGIEWWRCTIPACGHLFSAWVRLAPVRRDQPAFPVRPPVQPGVFSLEETI
jgi:hypothetical protein